MVRCVDWAVPVILVLITIFVFLATFGTFKRKSRLTAPVFSGTAQVLKDSYTTKDLITVAISYENPSQKDWIGIWPAGEGPQAEYVSGFMKPVAWIYVCADCPLNLTDAEISFGMDLDGDESNWPLCNGDWQVYLMDGVLSKPLTTSAPFKVRGSDCYGVCGAATAPLSYHKHKQPINNSSLSRIAFGSDFSPADQISGAMWDHMRNVFQPDLWLWVGDATFADGESMEVKRSGYTASKEDPHYLTFGPLAEPKIPVTGVWDDHDGASDNAGKEYSCRPQSQDEFVHFFDLPETDPRHMVHGDKRQRGIYSSYMFSTPQGNLSALHLIQLDCRYFRSPTFETHGKCEGPSSDMLGSEQWSWLENELKRPSQIKVIVTSIQALQATSRADHPKVFCAYDGKGGTFDQAAIDLHEDNDNIQATGFESWAQLPQSRTRLLQLAQKSINAGFADKVIFVSGDQQWGEIASKAMPKSIAYGASQTLFEITSSGIGTTWAEADYNSNRLRIRTSDQQGDGFFDEECKFPFTYQGSEYTACTVAGGRMPWCGLGGDDWGFCLPESMEAVPHTNFTFSGSHMCSNNYMHVCNTPANYGGLEVDWEKRLITLSIFTPYDDDPVAASVVLGF
jgi:alkaline phosphatase D